MGLTGRWEGGQHTLRLSRPGFDLCTYVPVTVFLCPHDKSQFGIHRVRSWGLLWPVGAGFPDERWPLTSQSIRAFGLSGSPGALAYACGPCLLSGWAWTGTHVLGVWCWIGSWSGPPSVASDSLLSLCCQVLKKLKMADPKGWPLWPHVDELLLFLTVVGGCLFLSPRGPISKQAAGLCWAREQ